MECLLFPLFFNYYIVLPIQISFWLLEISNSKAENDVNDGALRFFEEEKKEGKFDMPTFTIDFPMNPSSDWLHDSHH
jgi:hypothetical protein